MTGAARTGWETLQDSVRGANKRFSQDAFGVRTVGSATGDPVYVLCVADGHGAKQHRRSLLGARWAVEAFIGCAEPFAERLAARQDERGDWRRLSEEAEWLGRSVCHRWRERALLFDANSPSDGSADPLDPSKTADRLIPYGSTMLGVVISRGLMFSWQLGDGDIVLVGERDAWWHPDEHSALLSTETDSLCGHEPWRSIRMRWQPLHAYGDRHLVVLATDGLANSFAEGSGLRAFTEGIYRNAHEHGAGWVRGRLPDWLGAAAAHSGDDTTLVGVIHNGGNG